MTKKEVLDNLRKILFYEYLSTEETIAIINAIKIIKEDITNDRH